MSEENTDNKPKRKFLGVYFSCCHVYGRLYQNKQGTAYVGRTVFTLDQAYSTARVLGRVGNWLAA